MHIIPQVVDAKCPYCGVLNAISTHSENPQLVTCDEEGGGCGRWFAVVLNYQVTCKTLAIIDKITPDLLEALQIIVANARVIPDPSMDGLADCYSVPLDDIEDARAIIARTIQTQE